MFAGATARTIAVTIVSPLELIRTKMQSKKLSYAGTVQLPMPYSNRQLGINSLHKFCLSYHK